jgi:hypothetical protein
MRASRCKTARIARSIASSCTSLIMGGILFEEFNSKPHRIASLRVFPPPERSPIARALA